MEAVPAIVVIARPGNDRRSLVALLKTLGRCELFLYDGAGPFPTDQQPPDLVLVDLGAGERCNVDSMRRAARQWPSARCLALVNDIRRTDEAFASGAHCALARSTPAGDLLQAVRRLSAAPTPMRFALGGYLRYAGT